MRIKGAMTILNKRAKFYGMCIEEFVHWLDNRTSAFGYVDETVKVLQAYEVYKQDQGYVWSGTNFETWVKRN
jgi:cyclophilin family peptidyl-prolyl cis-trans isomerase